MDSSAPLKFLHGCKDSKCYKMSINSVKQQLDIARQDGAGVMGKSASM